MTHQMVLFKLKKKKKRILKLIYFQLHPRLTERKSPRMEQNRMQARNVCYLVCVKCSPFKKRLCKQTNFVYIYFVLYIHHILYIHCIFGFRIIIVEGLRKQDLERHERFKGWQNSLFPSGNKKSPKKPQVNDSC